MNVTRTFITVVGMTSVLIASAMGAGTPMSPRDAELPKLEMPDEFALVFSFGYVNDFMPKDPKVFEELLQNMQRVGINTIHCKYMDWRLKLCEKYNVKMMIDLAVPEHDLKQSMLCGPDDVKATDDLANGDQSFAEAKANLEKVIAELQRVTGELAKAADEAAKTALAKQKDSLEKEKTALEKQKAMVLCANVRAICEQTRGSKGVWGYGLWYDNGTSGSILNHAVEKLRLWDPTHVTFVGSYRHRGLESVNINPGCYGWYDFHWTRGVLWHYLDMHVLHDICTRRNAIPGRYAAYSGLKQDFLTVNQSIAAGSKMILWFIGGPYSRDTYEWNDDQDLVRIAAEVRQMYKELMLIGLPTHIFSTPTTKTHDNKPLPNPAIPRWFKPIPQDFWTQVTGGEAMLGFFDYKDGKKAIYVANHNAFAPQEMTLKFNLDDQPTVKIFDRKHGGWLPLPSKDNSVSFTLSEGGGELLRIEN